jgi:hypothetical protein
MMKGKHAYLGRNFRFKKFPDGHRTHLAQSLRPSRLCFGDENWRTIQIKCVFTDMNPTCGFPDLVHFFVPLGLRATLTGWGVDGARITELNWGDTHVHRVGRTGVNVTILCTPAQHWSQRGLLDRFKVREFIVHDGLTDTLVGLGGVGPGSPVLFRRRHWFLWTGVHQTRTFVWAVWFGRSADWMLYSSVWTDVFI